MSFSLGVEEELFLVDAETLETAPLFSAVVPEPGERIKSEVFESIVEITTPVCRDAGEVLDSLVGLRREVAARAAEHGATILAAGTHPTARGQGQPIVPEPRARALAAKLGDAVYRQLVCGLHVHVDVGGPDVAARVFRGLVRWLPTLLALSANSPYDEGRESGLRSVRAGRLAELPTGGQPMSFPDEPGDPSTRHWDLRPNDRYGTLEIRIPDQQTDVRRSAGFAALVRALAIRLADGDVEPYDEVLYARQRLEAAAEPPDPAEVERLAEIAGGDPLVDELLEQPLEADRQLELGLPAAVPDLAERSLP